MTSGPNCLAIVHRLVDGRAVGRGAGQHDAAVDRGDPEPRVREAAAELGLQQRGVVDHLDVEHADQLLAFAIDRHARGAVLLAEDRERAVGQRIDVGDLGIADRELDEARVGAHVLGLADGDASPSRCAWPAPIWIDRCACACADREQAAGAGQRIAAAISDQRRRPQLFCPASFMSNSPPICSCLPRIPSFASRSSATARPSALARRSVPSIGTLYSSLSTPRAHRHGGDADRPGRRRRRRRRRAEIARA